jgi:lipopolysaccharide transport system permease protein
MVANENVFIRLAPTRGWAALKLNELWEYRDLLFFLTWRDVMVRYKQAVLGIGWAILQPLLTMIIFSVIFGNLAGLPSDGVPYPLFSFAALLPWNLFAGSMGRAGTSLVSNSNLLSKVYFPRLIIPMSALVAGLVDFAVSFLVLLGMMAYYGIAPTVNVIWLPAFIILALFTAFAVGIWLAALNVMYRDIQVTIPFLVQAWMFASPVAYSAGLIPSGKWRIVYGLNPMAGVIQGFRWSLLGTAPPDQMMIASVGVTVFLLVTGLYYFKRMERTFADIV